MRQVVERGDDPRQAQAEVHVHGVGPRHVADGRVGGVVVHRSRFARERVRQRRAERDEGDGRHRVVEAEQAPKSRRQVADDGGEGADERQRRRERRPAAIEPRRRHYGEQNLPEEGDEMHEVVHARRRAVLARRLHRLGELLAPARRVHAHLVHVEVDELRDLVHHPRELLVVRDGDDRLAVPAVRRAAIREALDGELERERLVLLVVAVVDDRHEEALPLRAVLKHEVARGRAVVAAVDGARLGVHRVVVHLDGAVAAVVPHDRHLDAARRLGDAVARPLELELAGCVVVDDRHLRGVILAQLHGVDVGLLASRQPQVAEERLVRLELVVVHDGHADAVDVVAGLERERPRRVGVVRGRRRRAARRLVAHPHVRGHVARARDDEVDGAAVLQARVRRRRERQSRHRVVGRFALARRLLRVLRRRRRRVVLVDGLAERHDGGALHVRAALAREPAHRLHAVRGERVLLVCHDLVRRQLRQRLLVHLAQRAAVLVVQQRRNLLRAVAVRAHAGRAALVRVWVHAAAPLAAPACVLTPGEADEQRELEERHERLPNVHDILRVPLQHEQHPHVREHGEEGSHREDAELLDLARLALGDRDHADAHDDEQVEGGRADDGGRAQAVAGRVAQRRDRLDDGQQDLGR
mmetsp:Transcript_20272/g.71691  ORF Transcript_20272/g.71691 Transcript_20272/m.71691 type:complete len:642 (-) Transcript_20272:812-2737(-)